MERPRPSPAGPQEKSLHAPLRARENLSVHPLMVDTMKELQSMAVRLKTPIAIIPKLPNADPPGAHRRASARGYSVGATEADPRAAVCVPFHNYRKTFIRHDEQAWPAGRTAMNGNRYYGVRVEGAKYGVGFGSALAIAISYTNNHSILWAIIHGILGWLYVIYVALFG